MAVLRRVRDRVRPSVPTRVRVRGITSTQATLTWRAARDNRAVAGYEVWRGGRRVARVRRTRHVDHALKPGRTYRYVIRTLDAAGNRSPAGRALVVKTPPAPVTPATGPPSTAPPSTALPSTAPGATSGGTPPGVSNPPVTPAGVMTQAMVDRLFWRAGFGPSEAERATWTGRRVDELVDFFLSSPQSLDPAVPAPVTASNGPIDPLVSRDEALLEWLDTMQRARNPLIERLAFFWHRLWAINRNDHVTAEAVLIYRDRLRRHGDLAANPGASFRDLAIEMTTQDPAMSIFLTGNQNTKNKPNENYAREFMELFTLGVRDGAGAPNYTQMDVTELARAFTGWRQPTTPGPGYGVVTFDAASHDTGSKTIFGQTANWAAIAGTPAGAPSAVDLVLARPAHAPFLVRRLWAEFIVTPIPDPALADLVAAYTAGGAYGLKPLLRGILTHPLIFESLGEPNMVKPPVVFLVGAQRGLGAPLKGAYQRDALANMQQIPYEPPNVAGWEGGLSWLNTNTTQARFDTILRLLMLKHKPVAGATGFPGSVAIPDPGADESAAQAVATAYAACGSPWLPDAARASLHGFAAAHPVASATNRVQRQYALRAVILGGPDAQVM